MQAIRRVCLLALAYKQSLRPPSPPTPNPAAAPLEFLGLREILVYVDPRLAATFYLWLIPGMLALVAAAYWARRERPLPAVAAVGFLAGMLFIAPWLYALYRILAAPNQAA